MDSYCVIHHYFWRFLKLLCALQLNSPMEAVFGAQSAGADIQGQNCTLPPNEEDHVRDSDIPSTYDTHLFPGGVPVSTQSQTRVGDGSFLHPLIQSLTLPPATSVTSIVSTLSSQREGWNSTQDRNNVRLGSYTVDANGSIIRDHNRAEIHDTARVIQSMLTGSWEDDGLSLDDFSASFGQALSTFLQDQTDLQNTTNISDPREQPEPSIRSQEAEEDEVMDEVDVESPTEEVVVDIGTSNQPPLARETLSETAEVSCAMAAGLTISQPALDDSLHLTNNLSDRDYDQTHPTTVGANIQIAAVREADGGATEQIQDDGALPEADPREINDENESLAVQDNDETHEDSEFTCPPDIDPEVFRSLPAEMQQEIIHQHEVAAQISESGLDPEALAALPEDLRREVIEEEQNQLRLREEQASQSVPDPANVEEMDNAR